MKSVTDHLAIISSFTASYTIADPGIFFPIFQVLVQNSETTLFLNLLILFMTEFQKLE